MCCTEFNPNLITFIFLDFIPQGIPTHDADGKELTKTQLKKLDKQFKQQEKKYNDYMKKQGAGN